MDPKNIKKESVITIYTAEGALCAIVLKDEKSRKCVLYTASEMGFEDIEALFKKQS